jgi:hypothetical protein
MVVHDGLCFASFGLFWVWKWNAVTMGIVYRLTLLMHLVASSGERYCSTKVLHFVSNDASLSATTWLCFMLGGLKDLVWMLLFLEWILSVYWIWWICQIQGRVLIWIWFEIQLQIHTFSYLSLTLSYLSFKNKVDSDGFQIKSKSNPNQYTPPGFGKSTKSNTLDFIVVPWVKRFMFL